MNGFRVDTNVISEIFRPRPDANVLAWCGAQPKAGLFVSVMTIGEPRKGITLLPRSARRTELETLVEERLTTWFAGRVLSVTPAVAWRWGVLSGRRQLIGRPLSVPDGLIAATALDHQLTVVTRNVRGFEGLGVEVLDPLLLPD